MSDRNVKRLLISLIVMGFFVIGTISVGTSYALLTDEVKDSNTQAINVGSIALKLTENFKEDFNSLNILSDKEGLISDSLYEFNIKNTGTGAALYSLYLKNEAPSGKVLDNKYIKVAIDVNGEKRGPFNLADINNTLVKEEKIDAKELISFKMQMWLDEKYKSELGNNLDSSVFYRLKVNGTQYIKGYNDKQNSEVSNKTDENNITESNNIDDNSNVNDEINTNNLTE